MLTRGLKGLASALLQQAPQPKRYDVLKKRFFMNYRFLNILMMMAIITGCAKPSIIFQDIKTEQIIHHSQMKNIENISSYVVFLNKGDKIPLKMTFDSEVFDIANKEINLILKQKVYFRLRIPQGINAENKSAMSEEDKQRFLKNFMIYLSPDAKRWAPYTNIKAVEEVFGIKGGSFSFGMGVRKKDGIRIFLNAKTTKI